MAGYVLIHSLAWIMEWEKELIQAKNLKYWRGGFWHATGEVMLVRMNMELKILEVNVNEALKNYIIKVVKRGSKLDVVFPESNWAPVCIEGKVMPKTLVDYYYGNKTKVIVYDRAPDWKTPPMIRERPHPEHGDFHGDFSLYILREPADNKCEVIRTDKPQIETVSPQHHDQHGDFPIYNWNQEPKTYGMVGEQELKVAEHVLNYSMLTPYAYGNHGIHPFAQESNGKVQGVL